ncbi:MAG: hypothetical protein NVV74_12370 [Magnetospirillum sp.]|nr:hypothetical protein [Magnetospirillum sp.]
MDVAQATRIFLLYVIVPLWLLVGIADWVCHRRTDIQHTTGAKESLIHLLMLVEMGAPVLAALVLEINALVLVVMLAAFVAHEATALWDVSYAVTRRRVTPVEQHIHSFLEVLPFMALSFVVCLHWGQALAIVGMGPETADWAVRLKPDPLPLGYLGAVLGAILLLEVLPYLEEFWRGWRANGGHLVARLRH